MSQTLQREFSEEALNSLKASPEEREKLQERIMKLFSSPGLQVRNDLFQKKNGMMNKIFLHCVRVVLYLSLRCIKVT